MIIWFEFLRPLSVVQLVSISAIACPPEEEERTTLFSQSTPKVFLFILAMHGGLQESSFSYRCIILEKVWSIKKTYWIFSLAQFLLSLSALLPCVLTAWQGGLLYFISLPSPGRSGGLEYFITKNVEYAILWWCVPLVRVLRQVYLHATGKHRR